MGTPFFVHGCKGVQGVEKKEGEGVPLFSATDRLMSYPYPYH